MNPHYLWLPETVELLTFFVISPALTIVVAYRAWRDKNDSLNPRHASVRCLVYCGTALLLLGLAMWMHADVRTLQYLPQLMCTLLGFLLFGVSVGYFFCVLLGMWRWHIATRLK